MFHLFNRRYNIHHQKFSMVNVNHLYRILIFCFFILFLSACGLSRDVSRSTGDASPSSWSDVREVVSTSLANSESRSEVLSQLRSANDEWKGAPYLLGGSSKSGIDCSAFTKTVLDEYFDTTIPRHTRDQLQSGNPVRRHAVRPGDLIFFRTDRGILHVGIAMEDGDFLHASYSSGVMISNVGDRYWAGRYLGARRVF